MIITCEECSTRFTLDDALISPQGSKVRCSQCKHVFTAFLPAQDAEDPVFEAPEDLDFETADFSESPDDPSDEVEFNDPDTSQPFEFSQADDFETEPSEFDDIEFDDIEFDEPKDPEPGIEHQDDETKIEDQAIDFEETELALDEPESEFDEPEFDIPGLALEKDETPEADLTPEEAQQAEQSQDPDTDDETADIEISFDQDGDDLTVHGLTLETEDDLEDLEFDAPELELSLDDDPDAELVFEDDQIHEDLEAGLEMEEAQAIPETQEDGPQVLETEPTEETDPKADDEDAQETIVEPPADDDKFADYDMVLDQDTDLPEPEALAAEAPLEPEDDNSLETTAETEPSEEPDKTEVSQPMGAKALIDPPSAKETRKKRGKAQKRSISSPVKILFLLFLLVIVAYVLSFRLGADIPFLSEIKIPYLTQILKPEPAPKPIVKPVPKKSTINGRFVSNTSAGELFVVTGRIENPSDRVYSHIRVKGTLLSKDKANAGTQTVFCGNVIAEEILKSGNISDIQKELTLKTGHQNTNVNIKPGGSVMFMLVFSNLPENLTNFTVEVLDFQPQAEK
ncbi:MAG: zinc-ribbon domain-containing protein [Desulfobacter sp.]|nr:MAG: zinc-ribbon domain-containing protein [Desulfobacter sp.]